MTKHTKLPVFGFIGTLAASLMLAGCIIHVGANDGNGGYSYSMDGDYSTSNKSVKVSEGRSVGDVSSVNGSVKIESNVEAKEVSNVNGRISIDENVSVESVEIVNGRINIERGFTSSGSVESVNGKIEIDSDSTVGGNVETVNGSIELDGVKVAKNVVTVNGSVYLTKGSVVEGDVIFEGKPNKNNWKQRPPTLKIDRDSNVEGKIIVYKDVEFDFADQSLLDKVERR